MNFSNGKGGGNSLRHLCLASAHFQKEIPAHAGELPRGLRLCLAREPRYGFTTVAPGPRPLVLPISLRWYYTMGLAIGNEAVLTPEFYPF